MTTFRLLASGFAALAMAALAPSAPAAAHSRPPSWQATETGVTNQFRGLAAVSRTTAWVAGATGVVLRTTDGGRHWRNVSPPDAAGLEFRDVEAFDARRAVVLAIGDGDASRIYATSDGGAHWTRAFTNDEPKAFYDCMTFFDSRRGLALSDPVDGKFRLLATADGGRTWKVRPSDGMPDALPGEFAFAASGTCLVSSGPYDAWIASGGGSASRVFHSSDGGRHWRVVDTPVPSGATAGIYSLAFRTRWLGIAVGGDYNKPAEAPNAAAVSFGGRTWKGLAGPGAYRSGAAWVPHTLATVIAVGPTGSDISTDAGRTWQRFDTGALDGVQCAADGGCWGSGPKGRVVRLSR
ncbi:WD40/YVTN/BNR-like repeat-containing protein [Fodinicola acaciae]|uniref:WD40/YVTN/BNR-like repeat-containing protein n=1 Tax=Fodinicola acaciae TaxID=2681555 RepID=UPI0013D063BD|nr:oxidoreductase [Fodinicola acaciae]